MSLLSSRQASTLPAPFAGSRILVWFLLGLALFWPVSLPATENPGTVPNVHLKDATSYVSNPDRILSSQDVAAINQMAAELERELSVELAVVALSSIGDNEARDFATELFNLWGIGKKDRDNGLLILLVTEASQRSVTFETGYGLEGVLPDVACFRLQQHYMVPVMREGDYSLGMRLGVEAVRDYLFASDYQRENMLEDNASASSQQQSGRNIQLQDVLIPLLFLAIFLSISLTAHYRKHRPQICPRCGKRGFRYAGSTVLRKASLRRPGIVEERRHCDHCGYSQSTQYKHRFQRQRGSHGGFGGGGFGGSGGFGGGFGGGGGGGFGGGSSGGGGASSRF